MTNQDIYTVGGTVQAGSGLYIPRKADEELLELCRAGTFAYVLTPRQLGKSSLVVSTAERLAEEQVRSVIIDLSGIGVQLGPEQWYLGLLVQIEEGLALQTSAIKWWHAHSHLGVTQRLTEFLEKVVLSEVRERVVIFVDEIDSTLSLPFTDDFYAAIRYLYNARSVSAEIKRLSFVLIGVAAPGDLIRDPQRTPFNIGERVDLTDFTVDEALPLAAGLGLPDEEARKALACIMKWTKGHPYLTQRLCQALADQHASSWSGEDVDRLVARTFFSAVSGQDNNLQFVRDMLTKRAPDLDGVLNTYRQIRIGKKPVLDEEQSLIKNHLKLSGVVCREKLTQQQPAESQKTAEAARLYVRNPIYSQVFDGAWVREHMPLNWFAKARQSGVLIMAILLAISVGFLLWANRTAKTKAKQEKEDLVSQVIQLQTRGDLTRDYTEYQKQASPQVNSDQYGRGPAVNQIVPIETKVVYESQERGSLKVDIFADDGVRVRRKAPDPSPVEIKIWVPLPPKTIEPAPGPLNGDRSSLSENRMPPRPLNAEFRLASFTAPGPLPGTAAGNCLNPHPGPFTSWYGEKNGCWVAVYRQWPDGCTHYQWYNACAGTWDVYPDGSPRVYWTNCVH